MGTRGPMVTVPVLCLSCFFSPYEAMSRLHIFIAFVFCTCILLPFLGSSTEFRSGHRDNNNLRQEGNNYPNVLNIMTIQPEFGVHSTLGRLLLISVISFLHVVTHATSQSLFGFTPHRAV